jgi:hypothetical protein
VHRGGKPEAVRRRVARHGDAQIRLPQPYSAFIGQTIGFALHLCQAVQASPSTIAPAAHAARPPIRDIRRKIANQAAPEAAFERPLARTEQIRSQQQRQRGRKLYSFHVPEVECIVA